MTACSSLSGQPATANTRRCGGLSLAVHVIGFGSIWQRWDPVWDGLWPVRMTVRVVPTGLTASGCKGPPRGTALDLALLGFCPTEAFFHLALEGVFNLCHKSRAFLPLPKVNWAADDHVAVKRHKNWVALGKSPAKAAHDNGYNRNMGLNGYQVIQAPF